MHPAVKRAREMLERLDGVEGQYANERAWRGEDVEMWQTPTKPQQPEIIYKTFAQPAPQQQSAAMDTETQRKWERWCDDRIERALAAYSEQLLDGVGEAISLLRAELRKEFQTELAALRADQTIDRAITRGEVSSLRAEVPAARKRNVA